MNLRKIRFAEWIEAPGAFNVFEVQEGGEVPLGTVVRFTVGWGAFPQLDQLEGIIAGFDTRDEAVVFLLGANLMLNLIHSRGF